MTKVFKLVQAAIFIFLASGVVNPAIAQTPESKQTAQGILNGLDKNGDGKVTKEEAPEQVKAYFDSIDANRDGAIDLNEAQVMADYANNQKDESQTTEVDPSEEATAEKLIEFLDANDDGKISKNESAGPLTAYFASIDSNQDGFIALKEAKAALEYSKENGNVVMMGDLKNGSKSNGDTQKDSDKKMSSQELVIAMDKNGDGEISKMEAPEDLFLFFDNYDTNADGLIDKKESAAIVAYLQESSNTVPSAKVSPVEKATARTIMDALDKNGDDKITKEEAPQPLKDAFAFVDTNKDGVVDLDEAQAMADYQNQQK